MKKFTKIGLILILGISIFPVIGCKSTEVIDTLVEADILTLPSINLDFVKNERIEITDKLLNSWKSKVPTKASIIDGFKSKLDLGGTVKHYLSKKAPTDGSKYFPVIVEDIGKIYVISQEIGSML